MRVMVFGPNLPSRLGGEMLHAHAEGCADIKRKRYPTDPRWDVESIEVGSLFQLAHDVYGDQIAESSDRDDPEDWKTYLAAISVFPCVKEHLPERAENDGSCGMMDCDGLVNAVGKCCTCGTENS